MRKQDRHIDEPQRHRAPKLAACAMMHDGKPRHHETCTERTGDHRGDEADIARQESCRQRDGKNQKCRARHPHGCGPVVARAAQTARKRGEAQRQIKIADQDCKAGGGLDCGQRHHQKHGHAVACFIAGGELLIGFGHAVDQRIGKLARHLRPEAHDCADDDEAERHHHGKPEGDVG